MQSGLVRGTFTIGNNEIKVTGTDLGYRYKWIKYDDTNTVDYSGSLPIFIIDYSSSMDYGDSMQSTIEAVKQITKELFDKGFPEILLVFFAREAEEMIVNSVTINDKINDFLKKNTMYRGATVPTSGFLLASKFLKESKYPNAYVTFMTDGGFNVHNELEYSKLWNILANEFKLLNKEINISCIGYQNDQLNNIKQMKTCFDKCDVKLSYSSITNKSEIFNSMKDSFEQFDLLTIPKLELSKTLILIQGENIYSTEKVFSDLEPIVSSTPETKNTGVSSEWITSVVLFEIEIGIRENDFENDFGNALKLGKGAVKDLFAKKFIPYFANVQKRYMELKSAYKSIKSRNIGAWKDLFDRIDSLSKFLKSVQIMLSEELNEKKAFEHATKIGNAVTARHLRTIQRRKIINEGVRQIKPTEISIKSETPLLVSCTSDNDVSEILMDSDLAQLKDYYVCIYSIEDWSDMINTCVGISLQYNWKEGDDWSPSRAYIERVNESSFVSIDGYNEIQTIFGGETPEHKKLYGDDKYIASAHDKGNAFVPVAVDPFFHKKLPTIKERLGHMISGSSLAFRKAHILIYVAVIKQCFNQLLESNTEKSRHINMLLLNTFKILSDKINCIVDKENNPLSKSDILYNIAIGNTAPYLFSGSWESSIFALTSSEMQYQKALEKYNIEKTGVTMEEFKKQIWEMVLRHWLIFSFDKRDKWEMPSTWDLMSQQDIETKLYEEGPDSLQKYLMNENKVFEIPQEIKNDLAKFTESKLMKLFKLVVSWADKMSDEVWNTFNKNFLPSELKEISSTLSDHFSNNDIINNYNYWTYWECFAYGQKDCFPMRTHNEISKIVANNINSKYGENLTGILADIKELNAYRQRKYETRFLPVTFTTDQQNKVNELFTKIYNKQITENEFKENMKNILGKYYSAQFDQIMTDDNLDVLKNLFTYCQNKHHSIWIKNESKLPFGCPANISSKYFLQSFTDNEFSAYYKPLGFGWCTKKYACWVSDLHPFMVNRLYNCKNKTEFINSVVNHVKEFKSTEDRNHENYEKEADHFYSQFNI